MDFIKKIPKIFTQKAKNTKAKMMKKSKTAKAVGVTSLLDQLESVAAELEPSAAFDPVTAALYWEQQNTGVSSIFLSKTFLK